MAAGKREFALMSGGAPAPVVPPAQPPPTRDDGGSIAYLLNAAWEGRRLIVGALATSALALIAYLAIAVPVYESDVLLQIEQRRQGGGQALSDLPTLLAGPQSQADIEIEVLQSRMLLGSVVDALNLDISASPVYFPVIGRAWARHHGAPAVASAPWGLSRFAWGGSHHGPPSRGPGGTG